MPTDQATQDVRRQLATTPVPVTSDYDTYVHIMKKVVSGGPVRAVAFMPAVAGLPDTIPLNRAARGPMDFQSPAGVPGGECGASRRNPLGSGRLPQHRAGGSSPASASRAAARTPGEWV
jgi:hypothetical protein